MRDFHKLRAFELADQLALKVYAVTRTFPREEQFGLTSQLRRAAVSSASNIVEGCARHTKSDYLRFLDIAFGSIQEVEYQLSLSQRLGFLKATDATATLAIAIEASKVLSGLIRSLRDR